jgi:ferredoxin
MRELGFLRRQSLQTLLDALRAAGYRVIGPQVRDGAIVYDDLAEAGALPLGWSDEQAPGRYRLSHSASARCFAWANGPQALKPLLFPPEEDLWQVTRDAGGGLRFDAVMQAAKPLAVIGVRACDLAALHLNDRHFLGNAHDPGYAARRAGMCLVGVPCDHAADTCFCASTGDGPAITADCDLVLAELDHGFVVSSGTARGQAIGARLPLTPVTGGDRQAVADALDAAAKRQYRQLPAGAGRVSLDGRPDHPAWHAVGERCLACGNCTSVCPTCFCHAQFDNAALDGLTSTHGRRWDSCFSAGHSWIHGRPHRPEIAQRYRQWLTHKLDNWHDQYGRSGCVGCGRCITWCPVGIDLTAEAQRIGAAAAAKGD